MGNENVQPRVSLSSLAYILSPHTSRDAHNNSKVTCMAAICLKGFMVPLGFRGGTFFHHEQQDFTFATLYPPVNKLVSLILQPLPVVNNLGMRLSKQVNILECLYNQHHFNYQACLFTQLHVVSEPWHIRICIQIGCPLHLLACKFSCSIGSPQLQYIAWPMPPPTFCHCLELHSIYPSKAYVTIHEYCLEFTILPEYMQCEFHHKYATIK